MAGRDFLLRQGILRTVVIVLFLVLGGNLFLMQVLRHGYFKSQALENRQVRLRVRPPRGRVLDRTGVILADNMYIADITLPRTALTPDGPDSTLSRLMRWWDLPEAETLARLEEQKAKPARGPLVLVSNATMPQCTAVEERERLLPGVRVESRPRRRYHYGELFAHVIGYVGEVEPADLDTVPGGLGYKRGDMKGRQGVEAALDSTLRGVSGLKLEEINAAGRIVGQSAVWLREVVPGQDVYLTLDLDLQLALAQAIGERIACGVALDVATGQVLASYSHPTFDPNLMTVPISAEDWNALAGNPSKPFFNRVVQATYPPASLYKPVTSLAGLLHRVVGTGTVLEPCLGGWSFGDRYFRCWKHSGHGLVDHLDSMVHSCDTYYYQMGLRLDIDQMADAARAFGLGRKATVVFPEEAAGNVPDTAWYDDRFGEGRWTRGVLLNNAIGQGELLVTPLQMAILTGRLATSGRMPDPRFVLTPPSPSPAPPSLPFTEAHLAWIRYSLEQTVVRGTGKSARIAGVRVAGKTGTAQNPHGRDHAWFMAFAPAESPEVAVTVIFENAGSGSSEAAPIAGAWLASYFGTEVVPPAEERRP